MVDKNERIAIIGGGPAGLSAGMYLEKAGFDNYVIFERNGWVGGKCHSPNYKGRRYEMGAIMGVPSYYAVHDVEEFCGVTHEGGPKLNRNYKDLNGTPVNPFDASDPARVELVGEMRNQVKKFGELLATKYKGYDVNGHRGVAQGRYDGDAVTSQREHIEGVNENLKDLALPFKEFCEKNGVPLVQQIWVGPFTSFGYGYFDEIPAAYVLKYLDFQTTMNFVKINLWTWKDGTQSIWETLNAALKHPALLNSDITSVKRENGKVTITVNGRVEVFDKLIVTAPLQFFGQYADIRDDEKAHFDKIEFERYDTQAFLTKPEDAPEISYYIMENMVPERLGHLMVYYRRWADTIDQPYVTYTLRKHAGGEELDYEATKKQVLDDLVLMGNPAEKVIDEGKWYYFPHVLSDDYAAGWYDEVEAMQGKYDTYYAGEVMSFGDMDETAEYSRELVERFFAE